MPPLLTITVVTIVGQMLIAVEWLHVSTLLFYQGHK